MPTTTPCPLCGHAESRPFDTRTFRGYTIHNRICTHCGLVYQSPRMSAEELEAFYTAEYRRLYQGNEGPSPKDLQIQAQRAQALLAFAQPHLAAVQRHLDIGCSAGFLLKAFQRYYDCEVRGIEPGNAYRQYTQPRGLLVYPTLEALLAAEEPPFDLVSMSHVLEHLPNPLGYLTTLREKLLTPNGWLLLEVPNLYCHDSFEVAHLTNFSAHTLRQTLRQAGYEIVTLRQHGQPRSALLPLYLTVLARPTQAPKPPIRPEHFVAAKRKAGMFCRRVVQKLWPRKAWLPLPEG